MSLRRQSLRSGTLVAGERPPPLILINGLGEQAQTWFCNVKRWRRRFDVHLPVLAAYDGAPLHERLAAGLPIDVDFLIERLRQYLAGIGGGPPFDLLATSMGGKVAVEMAVRHPRLVRRLVLIGPAGLSQREHLPSVAGVRRSDLAAVIGSVFHEKQSCPQLVEHYRRRLADRRWRMGLVRMIRGTMGHRVRERLAEVAQPTLVVIGAEDRIVDSQQAIGAARALRHGRVVVLPDCGHAPQIERPVTVNRLVEHFLLAGAAECC